jgi:LCCL domain
MKSLSVVCAFLLVLGPPLSADEPKKPVGSNAEVHLIDNSKIMLSLLDAGLPIQTPHGRLLVPLADIRRIDFGYRLAEPLAKQIDALLLDLAEPDTRKRDLAGERLLKLGPQAHPAVVRASKSANKELAITARQLLEKFQEAFPESRLPKHEMDVIHTDDAKIAGRIEITGVRALTPQFGERTLKVADIVSVRAVGSVPLESEVVKVEPGPDNLSNYQGQVGKVFHFKVTGANSGSIYGTDLYTTDSHLATAAVHAGVLKLGQTGTVKVTIVEGQNGYTQTTRNGITSNSWGQYGGSYKMSKGSGE